MDTANRKFTSKSVNLHLNKHSVLRLSVLWGVFVTGDLGQSEGQLPTLEPVTVVNDWPDRLLVVII